MAESVVANESQWLTASLRDVETNQLRGDVHAILGGCRGTIRYDNPLLTVRNIRQARQPWRVVWWTISGTCRDRSRVF